VSAITVTFRDETTSREALAGLQMQLDQDRLTVAELIRARVHEEVRAHNADTTLARDRFSGLVQPTPVERLLNGRRVTRTAAVDPNAQTDVALEAFRRGQFLLLVDDRQVEGADTQVTLRQGSTVSFVKLVPLVGG
jgi:hypothetical protein